MDNVINQSTVINGEKSNVYIGKKFDGYVAFGYSVFIGCSGTVQISMEEAKLFTLINCPNLIVENPYGNHVPVIRDGYAIGDIYDGSDPTRMFGGSWEEITIDGDSYIIQISSTGDVAYNEEKTFISKDIPKNVKAIFTSYVGADVSDATTIIYNSLVAGDITGIITRTTMHSGGGCVSTIMVDKQSEDYTVEVKSYGYRQGNTPLTATLWGFITPLKTVYKRIKDPTTGNL